jgi:hypothetical protein
MNGVSGKKKNANGKTKNKRGVCKSNKYGLAENGTRDERGVGMRVDESRIQRGVNWRRR